MSKYFRKRNVCREILFSLFTQSSFIHSYDYVNVSFIDRINNFHFSCHRYYSFKSCLKILKIFKDFPKIFSECAMFIRDRRNTSLTKNIVTAAPVTMNSTLDNAEVLDPLLKFMFKSWDVTQFIILLIIKKLPPITIYFHNFLSYLFIICLVILIFLYFLFRRCF